MLHAGPKPFKLYLRDMSMVLLGQMDIRCCCSDRAKGNIRAFLYPEIDTPGWKKKDEQWLKQRRDQTLHPAADIHLS